MKKIIFTLTIFLSIWQVQGQTDIFNWKLSAGASTFRFDNAFGFPKDFKSTAANLHLERSLNRSFSAGISLFAGKPAGGDLKKAGYGALTLGFRWDNGWLLGERVFVAPFHTIEAGYLAGETRTDASDSYEFAAGMTHGLKFRFSDRFSARIATGLYYPNNDSQGNKLSDLNFYQQWQLGLSYHFGARKISYRGPVFNAGDFFPVRPGTEAKDQLIPFDELEGIPQPIIRPRVVEEEKVIMHRTVTQPEDNRIDISLSDTLIQIRVSEGEAVTINIWSQKLGQQRFIEKEKQVVIDSKEAEEAPAGEVEEKSETVYPESPSEPAENVKAETIEKEVEVARGEVVTETKQAAPLETEIITEEVSEKETETIRQTEAKAVTTKTQIKPKEQEEVVEEQEEIEETKEIETAEEVQSEIKQTETVTEEVFSETKIEKPLVSAKEKQEKTSTVKTPVPMTKQQTGEEVAAEETVEPVVEATERPAIVSDVVLVQVPDSLMARYPVILTFPLNSAALQESHQETLEQVAADLEAYPLLLSKISGYTDKSGDPIYNMILSGRRAEAVLNFLMDCGIDPVRLSTEALGDQFSFEEFSEEERRVEIHLISTPEPDEEP